MNQHPTLEQRCKSWWEDFRTLLAAPVDGASLAIFRICFGAVMTWHVAKYFRRDPSTTLFEYFYKYAAWNFKYPGFFEWVQPWPEPFWAAAFVLTIVAATCVAVGLFYRAAIVTLFVGFTHIFLSEATRYNNHYYLMCLVAFLLIWMPANTRFSIDAWRRRRSMNPENPASSTVPFWSVFLLRAQLFVMYFYGGIAKINVDWLTGEVMVSHATKIHTFLAGFLTLPEALTAFGISLFMTYSGLVFDLVISFLLIWRRTRYMAIAMTLFFHVMNHFLFPIGVFPFMAFTTTLIFCEPNWPVRLFHWFGRPRFVWPHWKSMALGGLFLPPFGLALGWQDRKSGWLSPNAVRPASATLTALVLFWLVSQALIPLRHNLIEGDANWTEEGQDFSWRMMLRSKVASHLFYHVADKQLLTVDDRGTERIDWKSFPKDHPRVIYVPIDSHLFRWEHYPGISFVFEPCLGQRLVVARRRPINDSDVEAINQLWLRAFGRTPEVLETVSLEPMLQSLRKRLVQEQVEDQYMTLIDKAIEAVNLKTRKNTSKAEKRFVRITDSLEVLLSSDVGGVVRPYVARLKPFLLQGAEFSGWSFCVVKDSTLPANRATLERITQGEPLPVWIDISRLTQNSWRALPNWFLTFEDGRHKILWNHIKEINNIQLKRFMVRPHLIRQYACRIADRWESEMGRRPQVHVASSVMLNQRFPQPLVDPKIDLTATAYRIFGHNQWIFPLQEGRAGSIKRAMISERSKPSSIRR